MRDASTDPPETVPPPLRGPVLFIAAVSTAIGCFLSVLDITIVNISLPTISAGLGASQHEGAWAITSYAVAEAVGVPMTG